MKAITVRALGGPEVLRLEETTAPEPGAGQALVRVDASGVNFFDIRQRTGDFKATLPIVLGNEGAGVVEAVGSGVTSVRAGDRVGWQMEQGSYATHALVTADRLIPLPAGIDTRTAAAVLLQGLLAQILVTTVYPLKPGDTCLLHAAAGGVGGLLIQMAKQRGARVIGTVSREGKVARARAAGADEVIVHEREEFSEAVRRLTGGRGVDVVYDGVGRDTFARGLDCLRPLGTLVLFGQPSGAVPPLDTHVLQAGGGRYLTRTAVGNHTRTRDELLQRSAELFGWIGSGAVKVHIERTYPLGEAAQAQLDLASRTTTGKLLLDTTAR